MLHLDLLVLAAFGVSVAFFNDAQIGISVPIVYPLLVYLLAARCGSACAATARGRRCGSLVPVRVLAIALVFLSASASR